MRARRIVVILVAVLVVLVAVTIAVQTTGSGHLLQSCHLPATSHARTCPK
jgi:peptidoglycan/LPS O-acetylase OafA/YrhL